MKTGRLAQTLGLVLLPIGLLLLVGTIRNPVFDPTAANRAPLELGLARLDVSGPGDFVVYFETADCRLPTNPDLVRLGETPLPPIANREPRFRQYDTDALCGQAASVHAVPRAGEVVVTPGGIDDGRVALYPADDLPVAIDWSMAWIFVPFSLGGATLLVVGSVRWRRWKKAAGATS
jgi:hypothetical protein